jgi:hypothetical protein
MAPFSILHMTLDYDQERMHAMFILAFKQINGSNLINH